MSDTEILIMCIEKYPCLWDISNKDYHNRDLKDLAWDEICKEIFKDWETCSDRQTKCADLKKKWTNIRDYYRKEVNKENNAPSGSGAKKAKKYVYGDLLHFLIPIFANKRNTEGNFANDTQPPPPSDNEEEQNQENIVGELPVSPRQKRKRDVPTQILQMLQERQKIAALTNSSNTEDDDTKFLLSFRTYMKKMSADQKIDFQLGMLQLVKNINARNYQSSAQLPFYSDASVSPRPHHSSYTPVPQSSPYCNIQYPPPPSTYVMQPQVSPIYYKSPSPSATFNSSFGPHNIPCTRDSKKRQKSRVVVHSVTKIAPPTQETTVQEEYPQYIIPDMARNEDSVAAEFLSLQSQCEEQDSIQNYLDFKKEK